MKIRMKDLIKIFTILMLIPSIKCENLCKCGKFIDMKISRNVNKFQIDLEPLREFLQNPLIEGRRLYVVGNFGETDVLNGIILNELYENYNSINSPDCLLHKSKSSYFYDTKCSPHFNDTASIQLWNDIFLYESQNNHKVAIIFLNVKARPEQSQFESRIFSAFSWLTSIIYFVLGEESFYNEYYGKEAQECDFNFHINELDQRNEIDESILEIHSILSHQNIEMHEDLHFTNENLKVSNFLEILQFGVEKFAETENESNQKLETFVKNLKNFVENSSIFNEITKMFEDHLSKNKENLSEKEQKIQHYLKEFKEQAVVIYMNLTSPQSTIPDLTTPKLQRKLKIFNKKLQKIERIVTTKTQNFITEMIEEIKEVLKVKLKNSKDKKILSTKDSQTITFGNVKFGEDVERFEAPKITPIESTEDIKLRISSTEAENSKNLEILRNSETTLTQKLQEKFLKIIDSKAENLFDTSTPAEEKIRTKSARTYIKTLQKLFETSNNEIRKSNAFKKLMQQRKISIPLPCDVKC